MCIGVVVSFGVWCSIFITCLCFFTFVLCFFFFKQKTAYEMRISDWSSDVCSSDLSMGLRPAGASNFMTGSSGGTGFGQHRAQRAADERQLECVLACGPVSCEIAIGHLFVSRPEIGSALVRTPVTNSPLVFRLLLVQQSLLFSISLFFFFFFLFFFFF